MLICAVLLVFSACGGGGGGGSDDPQNPGDNPGDNPDSNDVLTYTLPGGTVFKMITTPDILTTNTFPTGNYDTSSANVPASFILGETEVTYQLWKEVCDWATSEDRGSDKYIFANAGRQGANKSDDNPVGTNQHPVTTINWRDAIVWCNALTEYYNANNGSETDLDVVYCSDSSLTTPIRSSADGDYGSWWSSKAGSMDKPYTNSSAKGFRLPGNMEWEYAARYIGKTKPSHTNYVLKDEIYYTKGNSVSGDTQAYDVEIPTVSNYGVHWGNSGLSTAAVKTKTANALGLYDMSGNVWEWCFDWHPEFIGEDRVVRGGGYSGAMYFLQVGLLYYGIRPFCEENNIGFRLCRNR